MSELNKCNSCGKFKSPYELFGMAGDGNEGCYETWLECIDCMCGSDLRDFCKAQIHKIKTLKAELKAFKEGIPIEDRGIAAMGKTIKRRSGEGLENDKTDWDKIANLTDEEIDEQIKKNPDAAQR